MREVLDRKGQRQALATRVRLRLRLRTLLALVAVSALAMGGERLRRRWAYFREQRMIHLAAEQFCRDSAGTFRCPEYWDPIAAESAAREAERHARLRRSFEGRW